LRFCEVVGSYFSQSLKIADKIRACLSSAISNYVAATLKHEICRLQLSALNPIGTMVPSAPDLCDRHFAPEERKPPSSARTTLSFTAGDVATIELERAPGVNGVLRVQVAGKTPRELRVLPIDGMLFPIMCLCSSEQSITMLAPPVAL
jgi:hypothetical protein